LTQWRPEQGRSEEVRKRVEDIFRKGIRLKENFLKNNAATLERAVQALAGALGRGNKVLLFGNGGSAADAQHIAAEFVNRYLVDRRPLPAVALTTDTSIITAIANDFSFEEVFEKQVRAIGKEGDAAIGISTSGNSPNVVRALKTAHDLGLITIGIGGPVGTPMENHCDFYLSVERDVTPRVQEVHLVIGHTLVELVDEILFRLQKESSGLCAVDDPASECGHSEAD
jgi:D-sedoheptulose 7-phosphate isomerase